MTTIASPTAALAAAIERVGSQSALARLLSTEDRPIKQGHVWAWLNRDKRLPPEFVLPVEGATNISRHDLRPDIFGPPTEQPAQAEAGQAEESSNAA